MRIAKIKEDYNFNVIYYAAEGDEGAAVMTIPLTLLKGRDIVPYFQPIVSLQTMRIIGYEAFARQIVAGEARSLGTFFQDRSVPDDIHLQVDRLLRNLMMAKLAEAEEQFAPQIFINLKPSWIYRAWHEAGELHTLKLLDHYRIDARRLVIEITEEPFNGNLYELTEILEQYRNRGCTIAIDDVGNGFSNLDRIAVIQPEILKIDLNILKKSHSHKGYRAVLRSFSILAAQIGASLLIEGAETDEDIQLALQSGARYVQGYWLSQAVPHFQDPHTYADLLEGVIERFRNREMDKYRSLTTIGRTLDEILPIARPVTSEEFADPFIEGILERLEDSCMRIYICNEEGKQLSSNFTRFDSGPWRKDPSYQGCSWIWRPFFIANIATMKTQDRGLLSHEYNDLETSETIQTYSHPLGSRSYIFIDLKL